MSKLWILLGALCLGGSLLQAAEKPPAKPKVPSKGAVMDYGPFLQYTVSVTESADARAAAANDDEAAIPAKPDPKSKEKVKSEITFKGTSIKLGKNATAVFDTDTLRWSAGWTGGFLSIDTTNLCNAKGTTMAFNHGKVKFSNPDLPGWTTESEFADPRPGKLGPIPEDKGRYCGLYLNGDQVVIAYTVGDTAILDLPGIIEKENEAVFTRTIHVNKSSKPLTNLVCTEDNAKGEVKGELAELKASTVTLATLKGAPEGAKLVVAGNQIWLKLPALSAPATFTLAIWNGTEAESKNADALFKEIPAPSDPSALTKGGTPHWTQTVDTVGTLGTGSGSYVVDNVTTPEENPYKSWMRISGHDFFSDGRMAVCTWNGDVWVASGVDDKLSKITWKRFAAGLFEPLGMKIINDKVYVRGRDQITILNDLNGDGEADYFENFSNWGGLVNDYHCFLFDLHTDREGNVYYMAGGNRVKVEIPYHGELLKVSKDGKKVESVAYGFRAPNGFGIGPNDEIVCGDNQGHWTPASKIDWIEKGKFYGYIGDPRYKSDAYKDRETKVTKYDPPLCWVPYTWDNSSGGQVWAPENWGPLSGKLLHTSYGKGLLFYAMYEKVGNTMQGGVVKLPLDFPSGVMRGRVNPKDGQVYLSGLRGWQTSVTHDGCVARVRYTGKTACLPTELHVTKEGVKITFTQALDKASVADLGSYNVQECNYLWSEKYGSADYSVKDPKKQGRDDIAVKAASLSADAKTIELDLGGSHPVMQMFIKGKVTGADGAPVKFEIANTVNVVP